MIRSKFYYYIALLFPFVVRAFCLRHGYGVGSPFPNDTIYFPSYALAPYMMFVLYSWVSLRKDNDIAVRDFISGAPYVFVGFALMFEVGAVLYRVVALHQPIGPNLENSGTAMLGFVMGGLAFGFVYVCVAMLVEKILRACRILSA